MSLACMNTCGAAWDLVHVVLWVNPGGLGEHSPTVCMGSSTLCLAKSFNVPVLSLHMTSAQKAELPESFSRRSHCCLAQEQMGCGNLSLDWGPESVLDTLGCFYLVIQASGFQRSFSPGLRRPGVPSGWVDLTKCTLTTCSAPFHLHPRQMLEESKWSHSLPVGCPVNAWHTLGRLVRNHWKRSNLGGICFITQLLLPNVRFAQHSNWFQLIHGRALARESSRQERRVVPTAGGHLISEILSWQRSREESGKRQTATKSYRESFEPVRVRKYNQIPVSAMCVESLHFCPERALLLQIFWAL